MEMFDQEVLKNILDDFAESWMNLAKESTYTVSEFLKRIENA